MSCCCSLVRHPVCEQVETEQRFKSFAFEEETKEGANSRGWQGSRTRQFLSVPGPWNPSHCPTTPFRNFLAGKELWEREQRAPAPPPPSSQLEPQALSRGQASSEGPLLKGPASQARAAGWWQPWARSVPGTAGSLWHHKGPFVLTPLALEHQVTSACWAQGPDCGLSSHPQPLRLWLCF